jgi:hypothetical protein
MSTPMAIHWRKSRESGVRVWRARLPRLPPDLCAMEFAVPAAGCGGVKFA